VEHGAVSAYCYTAFYIINFSDIKSLVSFKRKDRVAVFENRAYENIWV
jgi:hypothetical protein